MNTKLLKILLGLGSIVMVIFCIVFFLITKDNDELDDLYLKVKASEASAFGVINEDGSVDLQPLDAVMVAFWNQKLHNSTRITSTSRLLKFDQFHLGYLELTNMHNNKKLIVEIIVPYDKRNIKAANIDSQVLYRIKGEKMSLLLVSLGK